MPATQPQESVREILRRLAVKIFGCQPCEWQLDVVEALLRGDDVVCIAPTGAGKTLSFWLILLARPNTIVVVITPLNILGDQNVEKLRKLNIPAVNINGQLEHQELTQRLHVRSQKLHPQLANRPNRRWQADVTASFLLARSWH